MFVVWGCGGSHPVTTTRCNEVVPDIEQATTTDAFKGFDRETFEEFICEVMRTNFRGTRSVPAGTESTDEVTRN